MHQTSGIFWGILAVLYLVLAIASLCYGVAYDRQIAKAPPMRVTAKGGLVFFGSAGKAATEGSSAQGNAMVADLWGDLRAYLTASTWVNSIGFLLAAAAAVASFVSARQITGKVGGRRRKGGAKERGV